VHIRRSHHAFPIRPFLPQLIDALEDPDANVRECAKQSVIELFTGPAVTDGARTDLKKEMTKKGVRKGIVEGVLSQVAERAHAAVPAPALPDPSAEAPPPPGEYVPPSMALMNRKPSALPTTAAPRTASSSFMPRPQSRAAAPVPAAASMPSALPTPSSDANAGDVKMVYVSAVWTSWKIGLTLHCRLHLIGIWRQSLQHSSSLSRGRKRSTTGWSESVQSQGSEA
jgi:CLIP-associating protein 1/2